MPSAVQPPAQYQKLFLEIQKTMRIVRRAGLEQERHEIVAQCWVACGDKAQQKARMQRKHKVGCRKEVLIKAAAAAKKVAEAAAKRAAVAEEKSS